MTMYFFSEKNIRGNHAGTKARNDVETILTRFGCKPVNHRQHVLRTEGTEDRIVANIKNRFDFIPFYLDILSLKGETVIIQYPMLAFDIAKDYIERLSKRNKVIFLVHDIQSMRRKDDQGTKKEIGILNLADGIILHNRFMEEALRQLGLTVHNVYLLECFDYLYAGKATDKQQSSNTVAYAGNLTKAEFLAEMFSNNPDINFGIYGNGWNPNYDINANAVFKGSFNPDELPGRIDECFGLVWDGASTDGCRGQFGEYTRINNPHKMSLYIAAGIPLIVWENAAIAEFVQNNQIGICVSDVDHLKEKISDISETEYQNMREKVFRIQKAIVNGCFLKNVLCQITDGR